MLTSLRKLSAVKNVIQFRCLTHSAGVNHHQDHGHHDHKSNKFSKDCKITKVSDNKFKSFVSDSWSIGDSPNGGYLMTIAINAACKCVTQPDPLTVTAYYLAKTQENAEMDIDVEVLNTSNSTSTVQMTCSQNGTKRIQFLATFGDLKKMKGISHNVMTAPKLPPLKECINAAIPIRKQFGNMMRIANEMEYCIPKESPFAHTVLKGKQNGHDASYDCWLTFEDGRKPCLRSLAFWCDAPPPPVLCLTPSNWVPTLEYTVHFWAKPEISDDCSYKHDGKHWIRGRFHTNHVVNSMLFTDGELWSADGQTLLATSRQFARVLSPRT